MSPNTLTDKISNAQQLRLRKPSHNVQQVWYFISMRDA